MARELTVKQTKFVKAYVKHDGNGTRAALESYNVKNSATAHAVANETLRSPTVKSAIEKALAKHKITLDAAIKPIADGLVAKDKEGSVDHPTRLKASSMSLRLLGADKPEPTGTYIFGDVVKSKYVKD